jgi:hypothetical protein
VSAGLRPMATATRSGPSSAHDLRVFMGATIVQGGLEVKWI